MPDNQNESSTSFVNFITVGIIIILVVWYIIDKLDINNSETINYSNVFMNLIVVIGFVILGVASLFLMIFLIFKSFEFVDNVSKNALIPYIEEINNYCKKNGIKFEESMTKIPESFSTLLSIKPDNFSGNSNCFASYIYVMTGKTQNLYFYIFDNKNTYRFYKGTDYVYKSICIIKRADLNLPKFHIRDKNLIIDFIDKMFGVDKDKGKGEGINLSDDKTFSKMFVLHGQNKKGVEDYFYNEKNRKSFVENHIKGYSYEGNGEYLVISSLNTVTRREKYGITKLENRLKMLDCAVQIMNELE